MICAVMGAEPWGEVHGVDVGDATSLLSLSDRFPGQHVLVLSPARLLPQARKQASLLTAARPLVPVAVRPVPLGILATRQMAADVVAAGVDPGQAVWWAEQLVPHVRSLAWTQSVSRLEHPPAKLAQHVRSLLPGPGYLITLGRDATVRPAVPAAWQHALDGLTHVVVAGELPARAAAALDTAAGGVHVIRATPAPGTAALYGVTALVEMYGQDPSSPGAAPTGPACSVCDAQVVLPTCPYCGVAAARPASSGAPSRTHTPIDVTGGGTA